ncbi:MAG: sensor histidine kinase [Acidobacteria bacterium]|nr:MAG: sensor histidine kinase [Acidobacteriota bacterium]
MSFRTRLLLIIGTAVVAASTAGTWILLVTTTRAFEQLDEQRRLALLQQFWRSFDTQGKEIARRVQAIADSEVCIRMAVDLSRPGGDPGRYVDQAQALAAQHSLDLLEIVSGDGRIVSSAQWPARYGYLHPLETQLRRQDDGTVFLSKQQLPDLLAIAVTAIARVNPRESRLYILGGQRLDRRFLSNIALPAGMRLFLYPNVEPTFSPRLLTGTGDDEDLERLAPIVNSVRETRREYTSTVSWSEDTADSDQVQAIPLKGLDDELLAILMVGSSRSDIIQLRRFIGMMGLIAAIGGVILGVGAGWWATRRVTRPIQKLVEGAGRVSRGNWDTRVYVDSKDEIGDLAKAFNQMTDQLLDQRDRLMQAERVAAWREVARRLAHEIKNPLFPLQITLENLQRAKNGHPDQFDEVFQESTDAILSELNSLKTIVANFSEFAKMPQPHLQPADLNAIVEEKARLFQSQLISRTDSRIDLQTALETKATVVQADPEQIGRVLQNLILNAIDAMPQGGTLVVRTREHAAGILIEVEDSGVGLTPEERERVFTPYYTTKQHGTGLGLAIVQSIVSDHRGRISIESEPGRGTIFRVWLARA